jgi:hypothetical protein
MNTRSCSWYMIFLLLSRFVDFDFNALSGSLPTELYLLTDLIQLDLNNNQLTGNVDQLGVFVDLEFLQLHGAYSRCINCCWSP